jgi:hypothetical protein
LAVAIKKLFLCHPREAAAEVQMLAEVLQLHGIVPWVDQQGGFSLGDAQIDTARRVIREECFGLLLYATTEAFKSDFISRVEMNEALSAHDDDPAFQLVALPRRIEFSELSRLSLAAYGLDFAAFASHTLTGNGVNAEGTALDALFAEVARELLLKALALTPMPLNSLQFQYSTRDRLADEADDVLCVDAVHLFNQSGAVTDGGRWELLHQGLRDIKEIISDAFGRPRLQVHGSKHLTAAFLLGYAFPSTAFELDLRVKHGVWATDCRPAMDLRVSVDVRGDSANSTALHVEISTLHQAVADAVRRYVKQTGQPPLATLRLTVSPVAYDGLMTNAAAVAIAHRVRQEVAQIVSRQPIDQIHLFAAVPQTLATMIGQRLNALPPVQLYEYDGQEYHPSFCLR